MLSNKILLNLNPQSRRSDNRILYEEQCHFLSEGGEDIRSLLARVDVLFYWNGIPILRTFKGKVNWFKKSDFEKSGIK